jgi:hypothetical protein
MLLLGRPAFARFRDDQCPQLLEEQIPYPFNVTGLIRIELSFIAELLSSGLYLKRV